MKVHRGHLYFISGGYLIAMAFLLGFVLPGIHFPTAIEVAFKAAAILSVTLILGVSILTIYQSVHSRSAQLFFTPVGVAVMVFSMCIGVLTILNLTGFIYGKPVVGAAFSALVLSIILGAVFGVVRLAHKRS